MLVIIFLISLIPAVILYFWLKNKIKDDPAYKETCRKALIRGLLSTLPVVLTSMVLNIVFALLIKDHESLLYIGLYNNYVAKRSSVWAFPRGLPRRSSSRFSVLR